MLPVTRSYQHTPWPETSLDDECLLLAQSGNNAALFLLHHLPKSGLIENVPSMVQGYGQATTLRFTFHDARPGSASSSQQAAASQGSNSIEVQNLHRRTEDDFSVLAEVAQGHKSSHEER